MIVLLCALRASAAPPTETGDTGTPTDTDDTATETADTGIPDPGLDLDDDRDGYTPRGGDCDDAEPLSHPGTPEVCGDRLDNDCDGLYDGGCDDAVRLATIRGGGGCTSGTGVAGTEGALLLLPLSLLVLVGWRRR